MVFKHWMVEHTWNLVPALTISFAFFVLILSGESCLHHSQRKQVEGLECSEASGWGFDSVYYILCDLHFLRKSPSDQNPDKDINRESIFQINLLQTNISCLILFSPWIRAQPAAEALYLIMEEISLARLKKNLNKSFQSPDGLSMTLKKYGVRNSAQWLKPWPKRVLI